MSLRNLMKKRNELLVNEGNSSLIARVYTLFLIQPDQIGGDAANCVPLNLSDENHKSVFMNSVRKSVELLKSKCRHGDCDECKVDSAFIKAQQIVFG